MSNVCKFCGEIIYNKDNCYICLNYVCSNCDNLQNCRLCKNYKCKQCNVNNWCLCENKYCEKCYLYNNNVYYCNCGILYCKVCLPTNSTINESRCNLCKTFYCDSNECNKLIINCNKCNDAYCDTKYGRNCSHIKTNTKSKGCKCIQCETCVYSTILTEEDIKIKDIYINDCSKCANKKYKIKQLTKLPNNINRSLPPELCMYIMETI